MKNENKLTGQSTILLIDDHPMLRNGVKQLISLEPTLKVIGEADDGITGIKIAEEQDPDLILLDLNMPSMNGLKYSIIYVTANFRAVLSYLRCPIMAKT